MTDRTVKLLLLAIALGLWANIAVSLIRPVAASAQSEISCDGTLKANAFGGIEPSIGGYKISMKCE